MPEPFDKDDLMDRVDGDAEFLAETVEILDEDGPPLLAEIREAAGALDAERLARAAHTYKGMVNNFCAEPAASAAQRVEEMGRTGTLDGVEQAVAAIEEESKRLKTALGALVRSLQA